MVVLLTQIMDLRNEIAMKAQRKQMNARSLLNNAFLNITFIFIQIYNTR